MNDEEKFFRFLNNKMSEHEKNKFQKELHSSEKISAEFNSYKKVFEFINEVKSVSLNPAYSENIIPVFRNKLHKQNKHRIYFKFAYGIALIIVSLVGYLLLDQNKNNSVDTVEQIYSNLTNQELDNIYNDYDIDVEKILDDAVINNIDSMYLEKVDQNYIEGYSSSDIIPFNNLDINELQKYMEQGQMDLVYSELLNKKIL